jgi:hypothetical protein
MVAAQVDVLDTLGLCVEDGAGRRLLAGQDPLPVSLFGLHLSSSSVVGVWKPASI